MKDFAKSYDQKSWEYAAKEHARSLKVLKGIAALDPEISSRVFIQRQISYHTAQVAELEAKYPQLKGN